MNAHNTLPNRSIKSLYTLALAEGEGVGTAYEYYAKRLVLRPWLKNLPPIKRILIAGLPEKYGSGLDHLLLAEELAAEAVIVEDRLEAIEKLNYSLLKAQALGWFTAVNQHYIRIEKLSELDRLPGHFDLAISNEVLQRLPASERVTYVRGQAKLATAVAIFCPNGQNPDHATHSGLATLRLKELEFLMTQLPNYPITASGYIDMPPFPTGVSRSEEQRAQANSGQVEAIVMWGLGYYARIEKILPERLRRQNSHIIYSLSQR